jgi:hypothetical protein
MANEIVRMQIIKIFKIWSLMYCNGFLNAKKPLQYMLKVMLGRGAKLVLVATRTNLAFKKPLQQEPIWHLFPT